MENKLHREPATFEKIRATLDRVSEKQEKFAAGIEELRRLSKEDKERMKKLEELFTGQWGKLMESLVEGDLVALLQAREITVECTYPRVRGQRNGVEYLDEIAAGGPVHISTRARPAQWRALRI